MSSSSVKILWKDGKLKRNDVLSCLRCKKPMSNVLEGLLERASDHSRLGYHHSSGQSRGPFVKLKLEEV